MFKMNMVLNFSSHNAPDTVFMFTMTTIIKVRYSQTSGYNKVVIVAEMLLKLLFIFELAYSGLK